MVDHRLQHVWKTRINGMVDHRLQHVWKTQINGMVDHRLQHVWKTRINGMVDHGLQHVWKTWINGMVDHGLQYESGLELCPLVAFIFTRLFVDWRNEQDACPYCIVDKLLLSFLGAELVRIL